MPNTITLLRTVVREMLSEAAKQQKKHKCPPETQDVSRNLRNREKAIEEQKYGPANPSLPNKKFWSEKAAMWNDISVAEAKTMRCGNCAAFDRTPQMLKCIRDGLGEGGTDSYDTVDAGTLGYCHMLKFKCAAARTCDAWVTKKRLDH
jgi:hypothetical protein